VFPERLIAKKKLQKKRTRLQHNLLREDFGRKSFAARISSDFGENNCVYAKNSNGATTNWRHASANGKRNKKCMVHQHGVSTRVGARADHASAITRTSAILPVWLALFD
jgi:hypothetical protein